MGGFEVLGDGRGGAGREYLPASDDHPPPLHLDLDHPQGEAGPGEPAGGDGSDEAGEVDGPRRPWQHWAALGLAVVVGLAIGVIVRGANEGAADGARAELIAARPVFDLAGPVRGDVANVVRFSFLNSGPLDVDILDVRIAGWAAIEGVESPYPVRAAPGEWTVVPVTLTPECTTRPGPRLQLRVRTDSGEQTVDIRMPPGREDALWLWQHGCENQMTASGVMVGSSSVLSRTDDALVMRSVIEMGAGLHNVDVLAIVAAVPGVSVQATGLPLTLTSERPSAQVELTWTVSDCAAALAMVDVMLGVNVVGPDSDSVETRLTIPVDQSLLVELARFSATACET